MKERWRPWGEGLVFNTLMAHQLIAEIGDASLWLNYFDSACNGILGRVSLGQGSLLDAAGYRGDLDLKLVESSG